MAAARPSPVARLTWDEVLARRLVRQSLAERVPRTQRLDVVAELCGLHAQVMSCAELTLWARVDGLRPDDVATELWRSRTLVKTWAARGTLHLLPAAEYGRWTAALTERAQKAYLNRSRLRYFGVTVAQVEQVAAAVDVVLRDGPPLTRSQLADAVAQQARSAALGEKLRESWGALLKYPAALGSLIFAPNEGQNVRFTHPQRWLGKRRGAAEDDADAALAAVTRSWLATAGPMTREELARWWGLAAADGRRMLTRLGDEVVPVAVDGADGHWMLADELEATRGARLDDTGVRLLPGFDQYTIAATRHAEALLPAPELRARVHRPQGWISPVVLVDGRMAGVWKHERRGRRLAVIVEPFARRVPRAVRAGVEAEVARLADFTGGEPALTWGSLE